MQGIEIDGHPGFTKVCMPPPSAPARVPSPEVVDLCARALRGEDRAWNELVRRYDRPLVVFAMRSFRLDDVEAEDLAQQTWLLLTRRLREGRLEELDMPGLAFAQARFLYLDSLRSRRRAAEDMLDEDVPLPDPSCGPEELTARREVVDAVRRLVKEELTNRQRDVLVQTLTRGGSDAETASALGLGLQRVRELKSEAYARFRKLFPLGLLP